MELKLLIATTSMKFEQEKEYFETLLRDQKRLVYWEFNKVDEEASSRIEIQEDHVYNHKLQPTK